MNFSSPSTFSRRSNKLAGCTSSVSPRWPRLALLRSDSDFDIAVLDVKLSGADRDSLGVAALLASKGIPFVFLTGMRVDDVHAKQFPQAPVIEKPCDAIALLNAVRRSLEVD